MAYPTIRKDAPRGGTAPNLSDHETAYASPPRFHVQKGVTGMETLVHA